MRITQPEMSSGRADRLGGTARECTKTEFYQMSCCVIDSGFDVLDNEVNVPQLSSQRINRSTFAFERDWLREKESNLRLRVQSPTCCRLHHPAKRKTKRLGDGVTGRKGAVSELPRLPLSPSPFLRLVLLSRWKELNRHRSIINRVL